MDCYSCDQPAINACKRCAKPYCEDHGNAAYCAECLQPSSALPSFNLYRGALLVMLVGTAVAIFLILRPPGETKGAPPVVVGKSAPTATPASGDITPTVAARTPETSATAGTATAETTETPATGSTPGATPSGTVSPFNEYTVEAGDTLFDIAEANLSPGDDVTAFARAIANLNNLDPTDPVLAIGQKLLLPKPR